jgi:hypothetical protein
VNAAANSLGWQIFNNRSAAATDAFELGVQQLVPVIRCSPYVSIVAVATISREL